MLRYLYPENGYNHILVVTFFYESQKPDLFECSKVILCVALGTFAQLVLSQRLE